MKEFNYKLIIEYDGSEFCGWQRQKKTKETIQEYIESSLNKLLRKKISIIGAGRTDAGVHAYNQTANFKIDKKITDIKKTLHSLNSLLPGSITIKSLKSVNIDFHSRYSALSREYIYQMTLKNISICQKYYYKLNYILDFKIIDEFIKIVKGYNSFKSLCKNSADKHNFFCDMKEIEYKINKKNETIIFRLLCDRYLHSMVRALLGTFVDLGRGRLNLDETILEFKNGEKIGATYLPANALFLNKINY